MKIQFSLLEDTSDLGKTLQEILGCSKNHLKKYFKSDFLQSSKLKKYVIHTEINCVNRNMVSPLSQKNVEVLFEDDFIIAFNKPEGIHSHPLNYDEEDNCLASLRSQGLGRFFKDYDSYDKGLLYRLDYATSGLMIFIKSPHDYKNLRENYQEFVKEKIYHAIVCGEFPNEMVIDSKLKTVGPKGERVVVSEEGREALSEAKLLNYCPSKKTSLIEVKIQTGVKHQIRCHLASVGYPILGDEFYGGKKESRVFLHAYQYVLSHKILNYSFECPSKFNT